VKAPLSLVAEIVERERPSFRHCCFCGAPTYGRACRAHRDLLDVDPEQELHRAAGGSQ